MKDIEQATIAHAHEAVTERINAVVGCAMFAPDADRKRDLPRLVKALRAAEEELVAALEAAGVWS
jgi:hypothetical protein